MTKKLFVGNLEYSVTEGDLKEMFAQFGELKSLKIVRDFNTGKSKGFAFVEMSSEEEATQCMSQLNGQDLNGRALKVSEAKENQSRPGGGGGGRGGFGGGGNRGGGRGGYDRGDRGGRDRY